MHCLIRELCLGSWAVLKRALQVYKQVNERYGKDTDPGVKQLVARSLGNQGFVLGKTGRLKRR